MVGRQPELGLEIQIDRDACIGSGNCCQAAPGVFALDLVGLAIVLDSTAEAEAKIVEAAEACPTKAISVLRNGERIL